MDDIPYQPLFQAIAEQSGEGIALVDASGNYVLVNPTFCQMTGYSQTELLAMNVRDLVAPETNIILFPKVIKGQAGQREIELLRKDGSRFPVEIKGYAIQLSGQPLVLGITRDITQRKQAEDKLVELAEFNRNIVASAPVGIVTADQEGRVTSANAAFLKMVGSPGLEETLKLGINIPPVKKAAIDAAFRQVLVDGQPVNLDKLPYTSYWGKELIVNLKIVPQKTKDGRISGMIIVVDDVTAEARAEEALRRSGEKMRSLARLAQKLERARNYAEIVRPLQEEIETILGYQAAWIYLFDEERKHARLLAAAGEKAPEIEDRIPILQVRGDAFLEEIAAGDHVVVVEDARTDPRTDKNISAQLGNRTIINVPVILENKRLGSIATGTFGDEGVRLPSQAGLEYLEAVARHIAVVISRIQYLLERTESARALQESNWQLQTALVKLKEMQDRMVQRERLAAVGQLAAGIAHDFNNILAVIVLYTETGLRLPDLPPAIQERLQTILNQAWRATDLVEQILDFSRRAVLEPRAMDLTPFLKEQVKLLARTLPENIRLDLVYEGDDHIINADPTRMQQVIVNLIVNARDAMPDGGKLRLVLARAATAGETLCTVCQQPIAGEWVQLQVKDSGSGIPPAVLPRIFEPFFSTKQARQGSGLGLSQVAGIVDQHGGHITVESRKGEGTTFTVYLPALAVALRKSQPVKTAVLPHGAGETILVVEDDAAMRAALAESIELLNYGVVTAVNGQEALTILDQRGPEIALVLSDLVMLEMGGQALFRAIRQRAPTLPVVMLSGHPLEGDLQRLQEEGLAGWLLKPPATKKLAQLLARALGQGGVDTVEHENGEFIEC